MVRVVVLISLFLASRSYIARIHCSRALHKVHYKWVSHECKTPVHYKQPTKVAKYIQIKMLTPYQLTFSHITTQHQLWKLSNAPVWTSHTLHSVFMNTHMRMCVAKPRMYFGNFLHCTIHQFIFYFWWKWNASMTWILTSHPLIFLVKVTFTFTTHILFHKIIIHNLLVPISRSLIVEAANSFVFFGTLSLVDWAGGGPGIKITQFSNIKWP